MTPSAGRVVVDGEDILALPPGARSIGYVFQEGALWRHVSVREHVAFGLQAHGVAADEVERRVSTVLGRLGLAAARDPRPPARAPWGGRRPVPPRPRAPPPLAPHTAAPAA